MNKKIFYIHGLMANKDSNESIIRFCSENNIELFTINLPGHGDKDFNGINPSIESFGEHIKEYILENKIHNFIICGHSLGGAIAVYLASKYAKQLGIQKLILEDPLNSAIKIKELEFNKDLFNKFRNLNEIIHDSKSNKKQNHFYDWITNINKNIPHNRWIDLFKLVINILSDETLTSLDTYYKNITIPTFIAFGENDKIINCNDSIKKLMNLNSTFNIIKLHNASHSSHSENPTAYIDWLTNIINQ